MNVKTVINLKFTIEEWFALSNQMPQCLFYGTCGIICILFKSTVMLSAAKGRMQGYMGDLTDYQGRKHSEVK